MKNIISVELKEKIERKRTKDSALLTIKRLAFNKAKAEKYLKELENFKYSEKLGIKKWFEISNKLLFKYNECFEKTNQMTTREKRQFLNKQLPNWMIEEMMRTEEKTLDSIIVILDRLEKIKIENCRNRVQFQNSMHSGVRFPGPFQREKIHESYINHSETQQKSSQADHCNILCETNYTMKELFLFGSSSSKQFKLIFDTGASRSFLNRKLAEECEFDIQDINPVQIAMANGKIIVATEKAQGYVKIENDSQNMYKIEALIMSDLQRALVLGLDFMNNNNTKINFGNGTIQVDGREFTMKEWQLNKNETDQFIESFNMLVEDNNQIESIVENAKLDNKKKGQISNFKHSIVLKQPFISSNKCYNVPESLKNDFLEKLNDF